MDYEPSDSALAYAAELTGGINTSTTVSQYDAIVAGVQSRVDTLWDGELVLVTASVASISAYYWQS